MKKFYRVLFFLLFILAQGDILMAQNVKKIDRNEAWQLTLRQVFNGHTEGKIIYAKKELIAKRQKLEEIREIYTPKSASWFFFVDLMPYQSWGHPCQYIFVDCKTGEIKSIKSDFPPNLGDMDIIYVEKTPEKGKLFDFSKPLLKSTRVASTNNDYAVIISGGMDKYNNYERYWNDCSAIYSALVDVYGYLDDHIYVLLADGTSSASDRRIGSNSYDSSPLDLDGDGDNDVQYAATKANIRQVFTVLGGKLNRDDHLFVFTTDHGGLESGNNVFINLWNETMRDDEFAIELNKVNAGRFNIVMEQCHSGGFIDDLTFENRTIATACRADENSFSRGAFTYNEFVYHWISAIAGITPEGTAVDADSNNDGWISMEEAFIYAESNDEQIEHPQYDSTSGNLGCMTSLDPYVWNLNGSKLVCNSGNTYNLNNLPPGASVTWTSSSNIIFPSGNTGSSVSTSPYSSTSSGSGWIEATINGDCGDVTLPRKEVWVGKPELDGNISGSSSVSCNSMHIYDYLGMIEGESSTRWVVGLQFNDISTSNGYQLFVSPINNGDGYVTFVASNSCGEDILCKPVSVSGWDCEYGVINRPSSYSCGGSGGMYMAIFPNPANEYTELNLYSSNELSDVQKNSKSTISIPYNELSQNMDEYEIQIWHESKGLVKQMKSCDKRLQIPTNSLPEGTYFLLVFINGEVHKQQLIIKR